MDFELYINWGVVGIIVLIALVIALLAANIKVVPQAHAFVIERLGAYHATWSTGLHLKIPFIDRIAKKVSLKEQVIDFPPQPVITKDNVTMQIDTVVYFQITDSKLYAYGVERPISAIENLSATTLRKELAWIPPDSTSDSGRSSPPTVPDAINRQPSTYISPPSLLHNRRCTNPPPFPGLY